MRVLGNKRIRIYRDDCLKRMPKFPDNYFDMILTDMPYGTTTCKWDIIIPLKSMWEQVKRIAKDNAAIVFTAAQPFSSILTVSNLKMFRYEWMNDKRRPTGLGNIKRQPMRQHEYILVFYQKQSIYNRQFSNKDKKNQRPNRVLNSIKNPYKKGDTTNITPKFSKNFDDTKKNPTSILSFCKSNAKNNFHPTQKPVKLMEYLIKTYTNKNQRVLDFTMGSGTTGVACVKLDRKFIGIEKDQDNDGNSLGYFDIAKKRIEKEIRLRKRRLF